MAFVSKRRGSLHLSRRSASVWRCWAGPQGPVNNIIPLQASVAGYRRQNNVTLLPYDHRRVTDKLKESFIVKSLYKHNHYCVQCHHYFCCEQLTNDCELGNSVCQKCLYKYERDEIKQRLLNKVKDNSIMHKFVYK